MNAPPTVSVILPTYNRAPFLSAAIASIRSQALADWELVVVDDGSTDDTAVRLQELLSAVRDRVTIHRQPNRGPYAARNTGLDLARGRYIAFFDSDDVWLPHHLAASVGALEANPDVDCAYGACRIVDYDTGREIAASTFEEGGEPRPFRHLGVRLAGRFHILDDPRLVACSIREGIYCGLQNAVFRARVFGGYRFQAAYRNEAEDRMFVSRALARGHRFGYFMDVHVQYHVHGANSSAAAGSRHDVDRQLNVLRPVVRGYQDLRREIVLSAAEQRALDQRIHQELFWHIGYALLWTSGRRTEAVRAYREGLEAWPWSPAAWKTYALARLRSAVDVNGLHLIPLRALAWYLRHSPEHPGRWRLAVKAAALAPRLRGTRARVIRARAGFRLRVDGSSQTGRILYATGDYEPPTSRVFRTRLRPNDVVVDVGANIGYFTLLAATLVGPEGFVMAYEPNPDVRARLHENLRLNGLTNVDVREEALGSSPGDVTFYTGPADDTGLASLRELSGSRRIQVRRERFDDAPRPARPVTLVKIDVEGGELGVIEGMLQCLQTDKPDLVMEVTDAYLKGLNGSASRLFETMRQLGYRMYEIREDGELAPIASLAALAECPGQFNAVWFAR